MGTIGERLKNERLERDFTLEQVSEHTKISKKLILSIEEDDLTVFPAPMYYEGFIVNICELYQIDSKEILNGYLSEKPNQEETTQSTEEELTRAATILKLSEEWVTLAKKNIQQNKFYLFIGGLVLMLSLILFIVFVKDSQQRKSISTNNEITDATIYRMNDEKETFDLKIKDIVNILFNSSYSKLTVNTIYENVVTFSIGDHINEYKIEEGENLEIDLDGDQSMDLEVRLKKISGELAILFLNLIHFKSTSADFEKIYSTGKHILVDKDYVLFNGQEKTPIEVYIKAKGLPSHLSYHIDGKRQNTTTLEAGNNVIISADEHMEIQIGNYKSVMFIVNKIPINLTLTNDKYSITKIIKWVVDPFNETKYDLVIKDYVN